MCTAILCGQQFLYKILAVDLYERFNMLMVWKLTYWTVMTAFLFDQQRCTSCLQYH